MNPKAKNRPDPSAKAPSSQVSSPAAMAQVIEQTVLLFHRMKVTAEQVHKQGELTAALLGVLRGLLKGGPQTVPQMARARPVSRQHIQSLVNHLLESGLVELRDNPAHKRSRLVALTPAGHKAIVDVLTREAELFLKYGLDVSDADLRLTARVLEKIRNAMASRKFRELTHQHD